MGHKPLCDRHHVTLEIARKQEMTTIRFLFAGAFLTCILACSSSSSDSAGDGAPGASCGAAEDCQPYTCACPSGRSLDNTRVCENKSCATQERACAYTCEATGNDKAPRTPTGAGRVAVCDESLTAFAKCPPSSLDIAECKKLVGDENCGKTAETYYACANTHASCVGGPSAPECIPQKKESQSCMFAF
jgi:hypothetical protein